jgi:hypothetical protein
VIGAFISELSTMNAAVDADLHFEASGFGEMYHT